MLVLPNGALVVSGNFNIPSGDYFDTIAMWSGGQWSGFAGAPYVAGGSPLALDGNGNLLASTAPGLGYDVARWSGSSWIALGSTFDGPVLDIVTLPNGDLIACGNFTSVGSVTARQVARWNGSAWSAANTSGPSSGTTVSRLAVLPNGDVVAGGDFRSLSGSKHMLARNAGGTFWFDMGVPPPSTATAVHYFHRANAMTLFSGDLIVGGYFTTVGGIGVSGVARWNGLTWQALGKGLNGPVTALGSGKDGRLVVGGDFRTTDAVGCDGVTYRDGNGWHPMSTGVLGTVSAVLPRTNGDIIVGGQISRVGGSLPLHAGGVPVNNIARWDGTSWQALGDGLNGDVYGLVEMVNGDIIAGGAFSASGTTLLNNIAQWSEASAAWQPLGSGVNGTVYSLHYDRQLVIGGDILQAGGLPTNGVALWNISTGWSNSTSMPGQHIVVRSVDVANDGSIIAGGDFDLSRGSPGNYIARFSNSTWNSIGSGFDNFVNAVAVIPGGDIVAAGGFTASGATTVGGLARWKNGTWSTFGPTRFSDGVAVRVAGNQVVAAVAQPQLTFFETSCPATSLPYGSGCSGVSGPLTLLANTNPWLNSKLRVTVARAWPLSTVIVAGSGTPIASGTVPLNPNLLGILPGPRLGCELLIGTLDLMWIASSNLADVFTQSVEINIPNLVAMIGVPVYMQAAELEISSTWVGTATTNGLVLTCGTF